MTFPERAQWIVTALYGKHQDLAKGSDAQRRQLTKKMAEQLRFTLGPGWGTKSASATRPPSKDAIAFQSPTGLVGWDWQNGTTRAPMVPPPFHDLSSQVFIEVPPVDHLGLGTVTPPVQPPVPPPVPPPAGVSDMDAVLAALARIESEVAGIKSEIEAVKQRPMPTYKANIFGVDLTLTPQ